MMRYGFVMPFGEARDAATLAFEAEQAGWDGFFVWEPVWGVDAWVCLTAAAMRTERIRLGTMLSPLSRMRPWDMAGKAATLDRLSNGRVILSVGLGAVDTGLAAFGEETDRARRAEMLDEGLDILFGLWKGQPFAYQGKHYKISETDFMPPPPPVQQPRIPVWVVGLWPKMKSMKRVLRCDGLLPSAVSADGKTGQASPADVRAMKDWLAENRPGGGHEIVVEGNTPGLDRDAAREMLRPWREAGATWWIEAKWDAMNQADGAQTLLERVRQGPPRDE